MHINACEMPSSKAFCFIIEYTPYNFWERKIENGKVKMPGSQYKLFYINIAPVQLKTVLSHHTREDSDRVSKWKV